MRLVGFRLLCLRCSVDVHGFYAFVLFVSALNVGHHCNIVWYVCCYAKIGDRSVRALATLLFFFGFRLCVARRVVVVVA